MAYFHRDGFHVEAVVTHFQPHYTGLAVQRFGLVEDEVADAVIDMMATIVLDGLEGVGMVAYEHVGTCQYEHVGIVFLTGYRLQFVFCAPMEGDDDDGGGVLLTKMVNT